MATADYSELEEYTGSKIACDNTDCQRKFGQGDVIMVEVMRDHVFCYSDPYDTLIINGEVILACAMTYAKGSQKPVRVRAMQFRGRSATVSQSPDLDSLSEFTDDSAKERGRHDERAKKILDF